MTLTFLLIFMFCGRASAETLILPTRPAGSGYRIIELENYPLPDDYKPIEYEWVKVKKSAEEIRTEIQVRNWKIAQNRLIQRANKTMNISRRFTARAINYPGNQNTYGRGKLYKIEPVQKFKWIQVERAADEVKLNE